jgi:nickel transport protein
LKIRRGELKSYFGMKVVGSVMTAITLLLLSSISGWAHKVNVFAYVEGDAVVVEGYFSGKVKAQNSVVEVLDSDGQKILEGKTDEKGICRFKLADLPAIKGAIKIVLGGGMGHKADFTLSEADLRVSTQETATPQAKTQKTTTAAPASVTVQPSGQIPDSALMKKIVEDAVDEKIQPLLKMLGSQQKMLMEQKDKGPTITEIVGGIGWILGIVGVAGYFMGRSRKRTN